MADPARIPVLLWEDAMGHATAALVDDYDNTAAIGANAEDALRQIKEFLGWAAEHAPWHVETDLREAELVEVKVGLRPEFRAGDRLFASERPVDLRVPVVVARRESGLHVCSMPTLGINFEFADAVALNELVEHYVKASLKGLGPRELSARLSVRNAALRELAYREIDLLAPRRRRGGGGVTWPALEAVAERILGARGATARAGPAWERDEEVERLTGRLTKERASVLLLGEPGVGKTTILAQALRKAGRGQSGDDEPEEAPATVDRFWLTSAARLIAGMRYLGQWEARCEQALEELAEMDGVLCVENLVDLVRLGGAGPADSVAAFLLPYLQRGEARIIVEATPAELDACRRLLPGFSDAFQVVHVAPLGDAATLRALRRAVSARATAARLELSPGLVELTMRLFRRFLSWEPLPGPAARFLRALGETVTRAGQSRLEPAQVWEAFGRQTGLPEVLLRDDQPLRHEDVRSFFTERIMGQPTACDAVANVVCSLKAGLNDPGRPLAVLLFCGPTGVGKTALAQALAAFLFGAGGGSGQRLVRLDMSEFAGPGAAERFLRRSDGSASAWIEEVRRQPFCVLLFDEIEKATRQVFDVLLNVFDEGRLKDTLGRETNFRSAVILLTSNLGGQRGSSLGFGPAVPPAYEAEVAAFFRPEFFNRLDGVVTFHPLEEETVRAIARKELAAVAEREGLRFAHLQLEWDASVVERLAEVGFDRRYGARPLQRAVEQEVIKPLARFLLRYPGLRGTTLRAELRDAKVEFRRMDRSA